MLLHGKFIFTYPVCTSSIFRVEASRIKDESSEDDEVRELALDLRAHIKEPIPRKLIKQTVMTTM